MERSAHQSLSAFCLVEPANRIRSSCIGEPASVRVAPRAPEVAGLRPRAFGIALQL